MKIKFNTKYLKTGGYSIIVSVVALAIIIVLNLFVNQLPTTWTKLDMSANDTYSLGEETEKLVGEIKDNVKISYICQLGNEDDNILMMLNKYGDMNDKITVEQVDPALNPGYLSGDRANLEEGSIIVESDKRSTVVTEFNIYYPGVSEDYMMNYYMQYGSMPSATGFALESCMTSALNYVTTDVLPVVYNLTGHSEQALSTTYSGYFESESMELKSLDLSNVEAVPEDCDAILICMPKTDITPDESERLLNYLKAGGRLMYVSYFANTIETEFTNLNAVLDYYGVSESEGVIYEGDSNYHYPTAAYALKAIYGDHTIVESLAGYNLYLGYCQGIVTSDELRDTVTVTPLLSTTEKAYAKVNMDSQTASKEEGDLEGPFDYAVAITETNDEGNETRIVWVNSPMFMDEQSDLYGTIKAMFVNSFAWMCDKEDSISIPVKALEQEMLDITSVQSIILSVVFAIIVPIASIVTGFVVWIRRRSR